jgi:HD superfamily phosphodiesterase
MKLDLVNLAKEFLIEHLKGKTVDYEIIHPWRKDASSVIMHSLRVHSIVVKIAESEKEKLSQQERILLEVASILHDIGKVAVRVGHAEKSGEIVEQWLRDNDDISVELGDVDRLISVIKNHSNKEEKDDDLCSTILKDADILDEIGALSIFMASNRIDRQSPYFFNELLHRIEKYEVDFCHKQMELLHTELSKTLLREKLSFIEAFIVQLKSELSGTENFPVC